MSKMTHLAKFPLIIGKNKDIIIEVLIDDSHTIILLDCKCCPDLLSSKLPRGVLIPISSTLKTFFEEHGIRNLGVNVNGTIMSRNYNNPLSPEHIPELRKRMESAVKKFIKNKS